MRRLIILSAALVLALAGCSSSSGSGAATTGDRTPAGPFGGDVTSTAAATDEPTATEAATDAASTGEHRLGDTVDLPLGGNVIEVTAIQFLDPNAPGGPSPKPASSDTRTVAVEFKIVGKGPGDVIFDTGTVDLNVRTATGSYPGGSDLETPFGPGLGNLRTFKPGQAKQGFATFSVPKDAQIQVFRFYTSTKYGDSYVDWLVQ